MASDEGIPEERPDVRNLRETLRGIAGEMAGAEDGVAASYHDLAQQALRQGRLDDALRLASEARSALRSVAHRRHEPMHRPVEPATPDDHPVDPVRRREEARRVRERSARRRDAAAGERERAASRRDELAGERDQRAVDRAVAAGRRRTAATEREQAHGWPAHSPATSAGAGTADARGEQAVIDDEMAATYREQAERDRAGAAADRAADDADREASQQDRSAAGRDRAAARADREAAARDRAAASADREQDEIDRQSGHP